MIRKKEIKDFIDFVVMWWIFMIGEEEDVC